MPYALPRSLETERLRLEVWSPGDAEELRAILDADDAYLRPWIPFMRSEPRTLEGTREWLREIVASFDAGENFRYALRRKDTGVLVGENMLLTRPGPGALEVGYWIASAHAGRGFATESTQALLEVAHDLEGVERVIFQCDVRNAPSNAIPRKLGAKVEDHVEVDDGDGPHDLDVWVMNI